MREMCAKQENQEMILVSACLLGIACRYDGRSFPAASLRDMGAQGHLLPICPEVAGGLTTPRSPAEIEGAHGGLDGHAVLDGRSRVIGVDGADVTSEFVAGAEAALALVQRMGIRRAILKAGSPSCGAGRIANGTFDGTSVPGDGVAAALLKRAEIQVITEEDLVGGEW
jgi:uncharacterized protein YbbK (DUF523 family)